MWRKLADIKIIEDDPFDAVIEECVIDNSKIIRLHGNWGSNTVKQDYYIIFINSDENTFTKYGQVYKYYEQPKRDIEWENWEKFKYICPGFQISGKIKNNKEYNEYCTIWFLGDIKDFANNPQKYPNLWNFIKNLFLQFNVKEYTPSIEFGYIKSNLKRHYDFIEFALRNCRKYGKGANRIDIATEQLVNQGVHKNIIALIREMSGAAVGPDMPRCIISSTELVIYPREPIKHPMLGEFYLNIYIGANLNMYWLFISGVDAKIVEDFRAFDKILDELKQHYKNVNKEEVKMERFIRYEAKDWKEALEAATQYYQETHVKWAAEEGAKLDPQPFKVNDFIHIRPAIRLDHFNVKKASRVDMHIKTFFEEFIPAYFDLLAQEVNDPNLLPWMELQRKRVLIATCPSNDSYFNEELQTEEGIRKISQLAKSIQEKSPYKPPITTIWLKRSILITTFTAILIGLLNLFNLNWLISR